MPQKNKYLSTRQDTIYSAGYKSKKNQQKKTQTPGETKKDKTYKTKHHEQRTKIKTCKKLQMSTQTLINIE